MTVLEKASISGMGFRVSGFGKLGLSTFRALGWEPPTCTSRFVLERRKWE